MPEPGRDADITCLNGNHAVYSEVCLYATHAHSDMQRTLILTAACTLAASVAFAQTPPAAAPAAQDFVNKVASISDMHQKTRPS